MAPLLVLLVLAAAALAVTVMLDTHIEFAIPLALLAITLVLYGFGALDMLEFGFWLILASVAAACLWVTLRQTPKVLAKLHAALRSPGVAMFFAFSLAAYFITKDIQLSHYDEFSHWGRVAKATFLHDSLGPFNPVDLRFRFYPPGSSLLGYFVMKLSGPWREGHLFWSHQLMYASLFTPFMTGLRWSSPVRVAFAVVASLATPLLVFRPLGWTLADPLVGYLAGFLFALIYLFDLRNRNTSIALSAGLAVLVLLKDTAALFAAVAVAMYCVRLFTTRPVKARGQKADLATAGWVLLPVVAAVLARLSWSTLLRVTDTKAPADWGRGSPRDLLGLLDGTAPAYWRDVSRELASAFVSRPVSFGDGLALSPAAWLIVSGVFVALIVWIVGCRRKDRHEWAAPLVVFVGATGYTIILLALYLVLFSQEEAVRVAGWDRYIGAYVAATTTFVSLCLIWLASQNWPADSVRHASTPVWLRRTELGVSAAWLCVIVLAVPPVAVAESMLNAAAESAKKRAPYEAIAQKAIDSGIGANDRVSVVVEDYGDGYDGWLIQYLLIESKVWIDPHIGGAASRRNPPDWRDTTVSGWEKQLREEFDYVALFTVDSTFPDEYGSLFTDPRAIKNEAVFTVDVAGERVRLTEAR